MTGYAPDPPEREAYTGERRVTLDLDDADPFDLYRAWSTLADAGCYDIEARVSAGGEGFHVRGWLDADDADEAAVETLRYTAGDHPRRVRMDRRHHVKPGQVLFTRKWDGEATPWRSDPWVVADELRQTSDRFGLDAWGGPV